MVMDLKKYEWLRTGFPEVFELISDLFRSAEIIHADVEVCLKQTTNYPESETWRRLVVRTAFSYLELLCNKLNQASTIMVKMSGIKLDNVDLNYLRRKKTQKNGTTEERELIFGEYFLNTIRIFAKIQKLDYHPPEEIYWQHFIKAIKVRNRLTHPKKSSDLYIGGSEFAEVANGYQWAVNFVSKMNFDLTNRHKE